MRQRLGHILVAMLFMLVLMPSGSHAQQDAMFTHYMNNTLAVNPGYAGSRDALTVTALHRSQWISFPGAPVTQTLTFHGPAFAHKVGLGLSIVNDKIGPIKNTAIAVDAAYIMYVNKEDRIAFGLKGGFEFLKGEFADIITPEGDDEVFGVDLGTKAKPNFGAGVYYYKPRMYVGISAPTILASDYQTDSEGGSISSYKRERHYYIIGGAVFDLDYDWKFKPTSFLKMTPGAPVELDITPSLIYQDRFNMGLMYRTGAAAGLLAGMHINEQIFLSYSFDWSFTNPTGKYNSGSHELMLRYDFIYKHRRKIKSPRYF